MPRPKHLDDPLPASLRKALDHAPTSPIDTLDELARMAGYRPQTVAAVRCGVRRLTPRMAGAIGGVLGVPAPMVRHLLVLRVPGKGREVRA